MRLWKNRKPEIPPGDDVCPTPAPVDEKPPVDRFCDLVLTGGVASGVVYPWAIVELARHFRFRNIGGTSVGAMAAALAAAAEYGRRTGFEFPFEPLRRIPAALGEVLPDGRTRMLSLFQPCVHGERLIEIWGKVGCGCDDARTAPEKSGFTWTRIIRETFRTYMRPALAGALVGLVLSLLPWLIFKRVPTWIEPIQLVLGVVAAVATIALAVIVGSVFFLLLSVWWDVKHGLIENGYGLCKGGTLEPPGPEGERPGLTQWLHEGIQLSAGLKKKDRPLTFRDLWNAPVYPGAVRRPCGPSDPASLRSINLQTITTNLSHERPYRLPLEDRSSWLYFKPDELQDFFPPEVLDALTRSARPYRPMSDSDPPAERVPAGILELPGADLPVVVAARLSLSFPFLFSAVPLWAVDYEAPRNQRTLRRCQFTDGGASSNFPIHLFDASVPRWPTFGLWLDRKGAYRPKQDVWLPETLDRGRGDDWNRFDPLSQIEQPDAAQARPGQSPMSGGKHKVFRILTRAKPGGAAPHKEETVTTKHFVGFVGAIAKSAVDWRDRTGLRLPHVRNRVARLKLGEGEGGLNIGMPRKQILEMAYRYGTLAGQTFAEEYVAPPGTAVAPVWTEHRWVRMELLMAGLRERLRALSNSNAWAAYTEPMDQVLAQASTTSPIRGDASARPSAAQVDSLHTLLGELEALGEKLDLAPPQPIKLVPEPELRLRAPL